MKNLEIKNNDCHAALAMTKSVQSGRSMIEMLGVLAIIGVLSVGGIAGYSKAMMKYRINKTIEQITLIAGNIRTFFANQRNYKGVYCFCNNGSCTGQSSGDGCPIHKKAKIFPDEMITITDGKIMSITNPFGGMVDLTAEEDNKAFSIRYIIPEEACIELTSRDWSNSNINYIGFYYNHHQEYIKVPLNIDDAIQQCSATAADTNSGDAIIYLYSE
ncbi:MAG: hypothetical protein IJ525_01125 [Alphaproteobacteria bacterium]|nr:hypothetical protein [Alphaproteobacteria bacterium]